MRTSIILCESWDFLNVPREIFHHFKFMENVELDDWNNYLAFEKLSKGTSEDIARLLWDARVVVWWIKNSSFPKFASFTYWRNTLRKSTIHRITKFLRHSFCLYPAAAAERSRVLMATALSGWQVWILFGNMWIL